MIGLQRIEVEGKHFVLLEEREYERLCREAGAVGTWKTGTCRPFRKRMRAAVSPRWNTHGFPWHGT